MAEFGLGRRHGTPTTDGRAAAEPLELRGERGRVGAEFDGKGVLVSADFCDPGRDPATTVAGRLAWERTRFERLRAHGAERFGEK